MDIKKKDIGLLTGGILIGTKGLSVLSSDKAKKIYASWLAAGLRAKECVMKTATKVQENAEDILAEAKQINDERKTAQSQKREG